MANQAGLGRLLRNVNNKTVKSAQLFIATIPVLVVYPFLQKHFAKGLVLGSVKG
jgi:putative aldouronate transport system permease protein